MVTSVHLAAVGRVKALRMLARRVRADGLHYSETMTLAPLSARLLPRPAFGSVGLVASWESGEALDAFLADHPIAKELSEGYFARMEPVRCIGRWPELGPLPGARSEPVDAPVGVLTLGRLKPHRAPAFLRASRGAEAAVLASPALSLGTAMATPVGLVCTFSVWNDLAGMRDVVAGGHRPAAEADARKPFHRQSAFIRFRILEQRGRCPEPVIAQRA